MNKTMSAKGGSAFGGINRLIKGILVFTLVVLALPAPQAFAQPYISITSTGGTSTSISISGVSYGQPIELVYTEPGHSVQTVVTIPGGYWNGTLNLNEYGIVNGSSVYVRVGGQQSNTIIVGGYLGGCTYNCGNPYTLSLSQNNVNLTVGQSQTVSVYPQAGSGPYGGTSSIFISSNSNPSAVSAAVNSANQIGLYGLANGSSTISICTNNYSYGSAQSCASIYVTVGGSVAGTSNYQVSIRDNFYSPQTITISTGSSIAWRSDGSMSHTVTFDSPYSDSGTLSYGNSYTKTFNTAGTYTYHCNFHSGMTGTVIVTGGSTSGNVSFSPSNPTMYVGQSLAVSINSSVSGSGYYYSSNAYYISNNTNPNIVTTSISGSAVYLYGQSQGQSQVTVCQNNAAACGTLYVTVFGSGSGTGSVWFSQNNVNININQSLSLSVYSSLGANYYISSNSNSSAAAANVVGGGLNLYGKNFGSTNIIVCHQTASNSCGTLFVSVGSGDYGPGNLSLSQSSLYLSAGQSASATVYNSSGFVYVSSNSNPSIAGASISGNALNVYASNPGTTSINICQNNSSGCVVLTVTVSGYSSGNLSFVTTSLPTMTVGQFYSYQLQTSGGSPPYNYNIVSGNLPSGLALSTYGVIAGSVISTAPANFTVRVSDNYGRTATANFYIAGTSTNYNPGGGVLGASIYKNGQLIKENGTIYIVYRNQKTGFAAWSAFIGFGFKISSVINVGDSGLFGSGYTISTSNSSHPWGSWIKSGQTVYFVHESGLIPIPDWNTFLNNGGQANWIVNANLQDFQLQMQSPMVSADSRLN